MYHPHAHDKKKRKCTPGTRGFVRVESTYRSKITAMKWSTSKAHCAGQRDAGRQAHSGGGFASIPGFRNFRFIVSGCVSGVAKSRSTSLTRRSVRKRGGAIATDLDSNARSVCAGTYVGSHRDHGPGDLPQVIRWALGLWTRHVPCKPPCHLYRFVHFSRHGIVQRYLYVPGTSTLLLIYCTRRTGPVETDPVFIWSDGGPMERMRYRAGSSHLSNVAYRIQDCTGPFFGI